MCTKTFKREVSPDELAAVQTRMVVDPPDLKRFLQLIERPLADDCDCVMWGGSRRGNGAGNQHGQLHWKGRVQKAHRVAYQLFVGDIPKELCVLHKCPTNSNGRCVNPRHLVLGTKSDNTSDMMREGNHKAGAKITKEAAAEIRRRFRSGETQRALAEEFGIAASNVSTITTGRTWRQVS